MSDRIEAILTEKRLLDSMAANSWRLSCPPERKDWRHRLGMWLIRLGQYVRSR